MGEVLIDLEVAFIMVERGLIRPLSLLIVSHIFVQDAYLEESVNFSLHSESVSENWILEIANGLINLVCLGKYYTKFVEDLTLLVEIRWHLKDSDKSWDSMVIGFELLV